MNYQIISPRPELKDVVQYFWAVKFDEPGALLNINTFVDDSSGLLFHHKDGRSAVEANGKMLCNAALYGQTTAPTTSTVLSGFSVVGVLFYPHAIHELFGLNASLLTDEIQPLNELFRTKSLAEEIINTQDVDRQISLLSDFLLDRLKHSKGKDQLAVDAIAYIKAHDGLLTVQDVTHYFRVSGRKLERHFANTVGVSPRHYLQVIRFQQVLSKLKTDDYDRLITLAFDFDFNDQAHFNNAFRRFSGFSPRKMKSILGDQVVNLLLV